MFVKQINYHPEEATESFKTAQETQLNLELSPDVKLRSMAKINPCQDHR